MVGLNASVVRNRGGADEEAWPSKFTGFRLTAGESIKITVPNPGGYGDPLEREPALALADVFDGFTTIERARNDYGVVIEPAPMRPDEEATGRLCAERSGAARQPVLAWRHSGFSPSQGEGVLAAAAVR